MLLLLCAPFGVPISQVPRNDGVVSRQRRSERSVNEQADMPAIRGTLDELINSLLVRASRNGIVTKIIHYVELWWLYVVLRNSRRTSAT